LGRMEEKQGEEKAASLKGTSVSVDTGKDEKNVLGIRKKGTKTPEGKKQPAKVQPCFHPKTSANRLQKKNK